MPITRRSLRFALLLVGATCAFASAAGPAATALPGGVGVNLTPLGNGGSPAFVDAMKEAAPWASAGRLRLDTFGNVTALAPGQWAETVIYPAGAYPGGDYTLLYDGRATFALAPASGTVVAAAPGRSTLRIVPRPGYGIHLRMLATDPRDYARNIRLIAPGAGMTYGVSPFAPGFVAMLRDLGSVRFAGWERPQPGPGGDRSWAARTLPGAFTQAGPRGVAPEYAIALANAAHVNPWFTLPVDATDDYVFRFAQLVRRELDPRLRPAFELGDEVWAPGTAANGYAQSAGLHLGRNPNARTAGLAWYALRSRQMFALVDQAFASAAERPAHVLSGPPATPGSPGAAQAAQILAAARAGAGAGAGAGADAFAVAADITSAAAGGLFAGSVAAFNAEAALASSAGVQLIAYRGGSLGEVTPALLGAWRGSGGGLFVADALGATSPPGAARALQGAAAYSGLTLAPLAAENASAPVAGPAVGSALTPARMPGATLLSEPFVSSETPARAWLAGGDSCLTAGTHTTSVLSIRPCNGTAPHASSGGGALQLTAAAPGRRGFAVYRTPLVTAGGLEVTFTDVSFGGRAAAGNGLTLFFSDAAQLMPAVIGAGADAVPGNAYLSVNLGADPTAALGAASAGSLRVRGAASAGYPALGGSADAAGRAADLPARALRGASVRAILTANGALTVALDRHDGNGYIAYYRGQVAGRLGQPALPAGLFLGFAATTGATPQRRQIANLRVETVTAATTWYPGDLPSLYGWYDAATGANVSRTATGAVSAWHDSTGFNDTLSVPAVSTGKPAFEAAGLNGLGTVFFDGTSVLAGSNPAFSKLLFNESTVFVVADETPTNLSGDLLFSGAYDVQSPVWALRPTSYGSSMFAFNTELGDLRVPKAETGATIWTAAGSVSKAFRTFRRDGAQIAAGGVPAIVASGSYPLAVGSEYSGGKNYIYNYRGQVGEIVIYNRLLAAPETYEVEGYLACKWGLQAVLPAAHPYRNTCPGGTSSPTPAPTATPVSAPGAPLPNPVQLKSANGQLTVNVVATADPVTHEPALNYNGAEVPPTLRLLPGDTLTVNLTNALAAPPAGSTYANDVNLHYHGLHVNPNAPADDSIDMVATPGRTVQYKIPIPANHPPGLYWYHSHAHAESERQNLAGMSGALIIEGIANYTPAVTNLPERILIVRDAEPAGTPLPPGDLTQLDAMRFAMSRATSVAGSAAARMPGMAMGMDRRDELRGSTNADTRNPYVEQNPFYRTFVRPTAASTHCTGPETASKVWTVNGVSQPSIGLKPGEQQFWRLVNAGSDTYLDVQLDNANMQIIALDGVPLISGVNTPASMTVSHYVVPPASRIEFLVTGPAAGQQAYLRTNCFDAGATGAAMPAAILASIDPTASAPAASLHTQRVAAHAQPFRFHSAQYITAQPVSATQTVYFSDQMQINGQSYDPSGPPMFYAQVGTTQDWTIVNNSTQVHTFHMHQIHFVVEAIDGVQQAQQFVMDNVNVPAATSSGPGTVEVRLDFTDSLIIGTFLVHCHILSHEDMGMMAKIRVGTAPPLGVSSSAVTFASPSAPKQSVTIQGGQAPYSPSGCAKVANVAIGGSTATIAPAGAGGCLLTIEDATGLIATVTVTVAAPASPVALSTTNASFASTAAAAQNIAITGGALPYTASGCGGVAAAVVTGSTLTVSPKGVGTCTIVVSDAKNDTASLSVVVNAPLTGSATDVLTFHNDPLRTGWNQHETALTVANVASANFGMLGTLTDTGGAAAYGRVYAQPLYVTNEATSDGKTHDLVVVATATDQVYAYDDQTLGIVWHRSFLDAPSVIPQGWQDTDCSSPSPDVGIIGTPVIDRALDRIYVVVATKENGTFHMRIHAISLRSGAEAVNASGVQVGPTEITGTSTLATGGTASVDPLYNLQRPALLESAGNIYVALGSKCDMKSKVVHGWLLAYSASTLQMTGNMFDTSNEADGTNVFLASIWMSGYGPAADPQGNVYFATGNGPYDGGVSGFGMSVVKVGGTLSEAKGNVSNFAPYLEANDSLADGDLGAGGVMLLPDQKGTYPHMLVAGGKCGAGVHRGGTVGCIKYVLNRDNLGGRQANEAGALWSGNTAGWMWGGPAYFADAQGVSHVVYGSGGGSGGWEPLDTYNLTTSPVSLTVQSSQSAVSCLVCTQGGGALPVVSSNGTAAGSAIVWAIKTPLNTGGSMSLYAFNALSLGTTLYSGVAGTWGLAPGASLVAGPFVTPLVANGKVYVPVDGGVGVFGLKSAAAAIVRTARGVSGTAKSASVSDAHANVGEHVVYGTIVQIAGSDVVVALRSGRMLRVDAAPAVASGRYSAPLFAGKLVTVTGTYAADGRLRADAIVKLGRADESAPPDR